MLAPRGQACFFVLAGRLFYLFVFSQRSRLDMARVLFYPFPWYPMVPLNPDTSTSMAYLVQVPNSPFWCAMWTGPSGRKRKRSTRIRIIPNFQLDGVRETKAQARARAQGVADMFERAERGATTMDKLRGTLNSLVPVSMALPTIDDFLAAHLKRVEGKSTYSNDYTAVQVFLAWLGKSSRNYIDWVTRDVVARFVAEQLERVQRSTVRRYVGSLSVAFKEAYLNEVLPRNPFDNISWPKTVEHGKARREAFTPAEVRYMMDNLPPQWASMVKCCYYLGGLRLKDCSYLRWSSFDLDGKTCTLETAKRGVYMCIPLVAPLLEHLRTLPRESVYLHPDMAANYKNGKGRNLSSEFSAFVRAYGFGVMQRPALGGDRRGLTSKTFHSLRYTVATQLHLLGVDENIAMKTLSHASKDVHAIYVQPSTDELRAGLEAVAGKLDNV